LRPAHGSHGAESFGYQQHAVAQTGVDGVERHHGVAAVAAVEIQRLHQQHLAPFVARVLLSGHQFADYARDQHYLRVFL